MSAQQIIFGIGDTAYRLPEKQVSIDELKTIYREEIKEVQPDSFLVPKLEAVTLEEVGSVHVFTHEKPGELLLQCVEEILQKQNLNGEAVSAIIDFSTTAKDFNGVSLCYRVQGTIKARNALTIAINNGSCASFQLALITARSLFNTYPAFQHILLVSEDRVRGNRYQPALHVVGDGSSAMLLTRENFSAQILDVEFASEGRLCDLLGVNHWQKDNIDIKGIISKVGALHFKMLYDITGRLFERCGALQWKDLQLVLYQNMSRNDSESLRKGFGIPAENLFTAGLEGHGHIFGSDLVINYQLACAAKKPEPGSHILMLSSGAGFSWGASLLKT